ncbi:DUF423 domain-containing protein [Methylohalobius crimeensis]|uniref:DUF423 domain-containing protein n=1 Tax=Methylohalobius crimeensis TaxID=244365 RepID=UPI0003B667B1|nr:DUF423 domain-containing protein [Methylohalobius crimeensis]
MRKNLFYAAVLAGLAVVMGAFGAHALKASLSGEMLSVWHTAVDYQMWHALGLGLIGCHPGASPLKDWSARLMLAGIGLFSGTLYLLALTDIQSLGMITPFGGLALIAAWILFALHLWRIPHA